jgi:hypothetical protein
MTPPITIAFAVVTLVILAACAFLLRQQRAHYESLLAGVRADNVDLRDRLFGSKNLPPSGTDMREHQEKREQARATRRTMTPKSAPDPMAHLKSTLANQEKRPETRS